MGVGRVLEKGLLMDLVGGVPGDDGIDFELRR